MRRHVSASGEALSRDHENRLVDASGVQHCEDCLTPMPRYARAASGWISPESEGYRLASINGISGVEAVARCVCGPCYAAAFRRCHPGVPVPVLPLEVVESPTTPLPSPPAQDSGYLDQFRCV